MTASDTVTGGSASVTPLLPGMEALEDEARHSWFLVPSRECMFSMPVANDHRWRELIRKGNVEPLALPLSRPENVDR